MRITFIAHLPHLCWQPAECKCCQPQISRALLQSLLIVVCQLVARDGWLSCYHQQQQQDDDLEGQQGAKPEVDAQTPQERSKHCYVGCRG